MTRPSFMLLLDSSQKFTALDDGEGWEERNRANLCPRCRSTPTTDPPHASDVVVQMRLRSSVAYSGMSQVPILKRALYEQLAPHMPGVVPGTVSFEDGRVQANAVTVTFPRSLIVTLRGGVGSRTADQFGYVRCKTCGVGIASTYKLTPPHNVLSRDVAGRPVVITSVGGLLVHPSLYERLDRSELKDLRTREIAVVPEPLEIVPELGDDRA